MSLPNRFQLVCYPTIRHYGVGTASVLKSSHPKETLSTLCWQNRELRFIVKAGGTYSYLVSYPMKGSMYISEIKVIYLDIKQHSAILKPCCSQLGGIIAMFNIFQICCYHILSIGRVNMTNGFP